MNDALVRELERALEQTGALSDRIALAETQKQMGDSIGAATTIMPAAFEPDAEATIRALAGPRPKTYENAVDLLAHKTFNQTDDLGVRFAYLRARIGAPEFSSALCDLLPHLADANMHASISFLESTYSFSFHPKTAIPHFIDGDHQLSLGYGISLEVAIQQRPYAHPLRHTFAQLSTLKPLIDPDILLRSRCRGTTLEGAEETDLHFGTGFTKGNKTLLLSFSDYLDLVYRKNSGISIEPGNLKKVTIFTPKGEFYD